MASIPHERSLIVYCALAEAALSPTTPWPMTYVGAVKANLRAIEPVTSPGATADVDHVRVRYVAGPDEQARLAHLWTLLAHLLSDEGAGETGGARVDTPDEGSHSC